MPVRTVMLGATAALFGVAAQAAPPPHAAASGRHAEAWSRSERGDAYVLLKAGSQSVTMSGSSDDVRRAKALRSGGEALLYVRRGGSAYVIRDAAVLRQAQALFDPQEALGRQQAELGSRQAALGREQARLGARQAALAYREVRDAPRDADDTARRQDELGRQQAALGRQQDALGREQDELGRRQDALGRAADRQIRVLFDAAVRSGSAQRVD